MIQALEGVDRLRRRLVDVDQALVRANLEVLARVLVLERRADHAVDVLLGRQRHRSGDGRARARRRLDDLLRGRLDRGGVIRLQADANLVLRGRCHVLSIALLSLIRWCDWYLLCRCRARSATRRRTRPRREPPPEWSEKGRTPCRGIRLHLTTAHCGDCL